MIMFFFVNALQLWTAQTTRPIDVSDHKRSSVMCKLYCLHFCQTYKFIQGCQSLNPKKRKQRDAVWAAFSNGCSAKRSKTCTIARPADSKFPAVLSTEHVSWWQHKLTSLYHFEIEGARPGLKISAPQAALRCCFLSFETQPLQRLVRQESWHDEANRPGWSFLVYTKVNVLPAH